MTLTRDPKQSLWEPFGTPWEAFGDAGGRVVGSHQVLQQKQANYMKHSSKNEKVEFKTQAPAPFFLKKRKN